jgi:small-conductance mechanosensitive channel
MLCSMEVAKKSKQAPKAKPAAQFVWLGSYIIVAIIFLAAYIIIQFQLLEVEEKYADVIRKISLAGFLSILVLSISKTVEIIIAKRSHSKYKRYNLIRLTHLVSLLIVFILIVTFLFANWYAAAVSLGLISLILGFALQTPISSLIGWIYILIRNPYRIGDRIQLNTFKGDVLEIGYLDTTLWEFAGDYLTNDLPSGRLIRFPNSLVLQSPVFNYSWKNFEFIWNEIPFHVAYNADFDYVKKTIRRITGEQLGPQMSDRIDELKEMVKQSPIDDLQIKEYPFVSLRINPNTWVEVTVTYLVPPKKAATIRTEIIQGVLSELLKHPEKALVPNSNAR